MAPATTASIAKPAATAPQPVAATPVRPVAGPAKKDRYKKLWISFLVVVALPVLLTAAYLAFVAQDRYTSTIGFAVRSGNNDSGAGALLGGLASITGASASGDSDILNQYIRTQQMVGAIDKKVDLRKIYSDNWIKDPIFKLYPEASIEDLTDYWDRIVKISYEQSTGLMQVEVNAFTPDDAERISAAILEESQNLINELNDNARHDAVKYAEDELTSAEDRLKQARAAITDFRIKTKIVDIQADVQSKLEVMAGLQQQLTQEQVNLNDLLSSTKGSDPRITQTQRRIDAIEDRIKTQQDALAQTGQVYTSSGNLGYPEAMAHYEALQTDLEFSQKTYVAAMTAVDAARLEAMRKSRYLATYISPTLAQRPEYPHRIEITSVVFLFLFFAWSIGTLITYSVKEHA